jgi:hypothetical protein
MADHPFSNFEKYIGTPFAKYLLPIIPVTATMSSASKISTDQLGKIPGRMNADRTWIGFRDWPNFYWYSKPTFLEHWQQWQTEGGLVIPVGLNTIEYPAIDIDTDDERIANWFRSVTQRVMGVTPVVRRRNGAVRMVLIFKHKDRTASIMKLRYASQDHAGATHLLEVLGRGQQVLIEGPHAKGAMHYWENGGLVEHVGDIPEITTDQTFELIKILREEGDSQGLTMIKAALPSRNLAAAVKIADCDSPHRARDLKLLARAIAAIDINDPRLVDYDTWCSLFRAMWAACGADQTFYAEHILPWLSGNPENLEDDIEAKLASFHDSQLGAEFLYQWASQHDRRQQRRPSPSTLRRTCPDSERSARRR